MEVDMKTILGRTATDKWLAYQTKRFDRHEFLKQELHYKINAANKFLALKVDGKKIADWNITKLVSDTRTPATIAAQIIDQIMAYDLSYKTMIGYYNTFRSIFSFFLDSGYTHSFALGMVKFPKRQHTSFDVENKAIKISKDRIKTILSKTDAEYKLAVKFAAYTGLRQGEQRELRWKDINFENKTISVTRCVQLFDTVGFTKTKNGQRQVPLSESLAKDLKVYRLSQGVPDKEALVFQNNGKRIFGQKLRDVLKKACKQADVEVIRWHDLRHFFASILLQTYGDDLHKVTSFMGHGSIEMTRKVYGHWLDDRKRNAEDAAKLDAALTL